MDKRQRELEQMEKDRVDELAEDDRIGMSRRPYVPVESMKTTTEQDEQHREQQMQVLLGNVRHLSVRDGTQELKKLSEEQKRRHEEWRDPLGVEVRDATPEERAAVVEAAIKLGLTVVGEPPAVGSAPVYADVLGLTPVYAAPHDEPYEPTETSDNLVLPGSVKDLPVQEYSADELKERLASAMGVPLQHLEKVLDVIEPQQGQLFEPDVATTPHPEMPDRVNRTQSKVNLPGGVLMDTRKFEKWVLENFVPLQDQVAAVLKVGDAVLEQQSVPQDGSLKAELFAAKSRISRLEQQVRELKAKVK